MFQVHNTRYDTYPLLVHNPFSDLFECDMWKQLESQYGYLVPKWNVPEDVTIITWNNKKEKGCFQKQLESRNVPYVCLGQDLKHWSSNRLKPKLLLDYIDQIKTKYILGADGFDVLAVSSINDIVDRLKLKLARLVFNATSVVYPDHSDHWAIESEMCSKNTRPFRYFNSGLFFGETEYIKEKFSEIDYSNPMFAYSDQFLLRTLYHKYFPDIQIDWNCEMFQVLHLPFAAKMDISECVELKLKYRMFL